MATGNITTQASSRPQLNPTAGVFNPSKVSINNVSMALVPRNEEQEDSEDKIRRLNREVMIISRHFTDEIIALRREIEMLKQGGWTVTVGPFVAPQNMDNSAVETTRQRLQNSDGLPSLMPALQAHQVDTPPTTPNHAGFRTEAIPTPQERSPTSPMDLLTLPAPEECQDPEQISLSAGRVAGLSPHESSLSQNGEIYGTTSKASIVEEPIMMLAEDHDLEIAPDVPLPTTEDPSTRNMKDKPTWRPLAIRCLSPLPAEALALVPPYSDMRTFTWEFIRTFFGGKQWSPGFYYIPLKTGKCMLPSRSLYILDASHDPYLPSEPGAHGAKLTAFFNPENPEDVDGDEAKGAFENVPLFISASPWAPKNSDFIYFGMYSQPRFSDKLDHDRMVEHVALHVKMYWAEQLSNLGRPQWVTEELMKHLVPKPEYEGALPNRTNSDDATIRKDIGHHMSDLIDWEEEARIAVGKLTKEKLLNAFEQADSANPPGLRLWWEYLECVGWDKDFYQILVREQEKFLSKH